MNNDQHQAHSPGTVSKILWHFTGGPVWNSEKQCQSAEKKSPAVAFEALCKIVKTQKLLLGSYREIVKVRIPQRKSRLFPEMPLTRQEVVRESAPVCCIADIPIAHLSYHASRYGKIAIGFHREAPLKAGFNPVFYSLSSSSVLRALHNGFSELESLRDACADSANEVEERMTELKCQQGHPIISPDSLDLKIADHFDSISGAVETAEDSFGEFLAFVKTFNHKQFSTIYCEREWRSTKEFSFKLEDIAMIVIPKRTDETIFERFIAEVSPFLPRSIPIVPWEDLIEH